MSDFDFRALLLVLIEVGIILCYKWYTKYNDFLGITSLTDYSSLQDINIMVFVGFGLMMASSKRNSYNAIGYNMLAGAFALQMAILWNPFFEQVIDGSDVEKINLNIDSIVRGLFTACSVVISLTAVMGRLNYFQMMIMVIFEVVCYAVNEALRIVVYKATDTGGAIQIHIFGAYFGLTVAWVLNMSRDSDNRVVYRDSNVWTTKYGNLFAMIGTLFVWAYFPSLNSVFSPSGFKYRMVVNTFTALTASCLMAFVTTKFIKTKFTMMEIQHATISGGIGISSVAGLILYPHNAIALGGVIGIISVFCYKYIGPFMHNWFSLDDRFGVHNFAAIPGLISGLAGVLATGVVDSYMSDAQILELFPARDNRSESKQALYQLASVATSFGIAIVGGLIVGFIVSLFSRNDGKYSRDETEWLVSKTSNNRQGGENGTVVIVN
jgi:ammonium transporter Rh